MNETSINDTLESVQAVIGRSDTVGYGDTHHPGVISHYPVSYICTRRQRATIGTT